MSNGGTLFLQERRTTRDHGSRDKQETAASESGESGSRHHQQKLR